MLGAQYGHLGQDAKKLFQPLLVFGVLSAREKATPGDPGSSHINVLEHVDPNPCNPKRLFGAVAKPLRSPLLRRPFAEGGDVEETEAEADVLQTGINQEALGGGWGLSTYPTSFPYRFQAGACKKKFP